MVVKFKGIDDINHILQYKGLDVYSETDVTDQLEEDDYHYQDLIGKKVTDTDGIILGEVISLIPVPQGHLLEIRKIDGKTSMVPFIDAFVKDVLEDRIVLTPIEGLL